MKNTLFAALAVFALVGFVHTAREVGHDLVGEAEAAIPKVNAIPHASSETFLSTSTLTIGGPLVIDTSNTTVAGTITLASGSPSTGTATVRAGCRPLCTDQTTQTSVVKCAVSSTTLTATGPNTVTDVVTYLCI